MIKSRLWTAVQEMGGESAVWRLCASFLVLGVSVEVLRPGGILPLEAFLWRPIMALIVLLFISAFLKFASRQDGQAVALSLRKVMPWAIVCAAIFALVPLWPKDFSALPFSLKDISYYLLSVGFWPMVSGPEGLLRGFVLGLSLFFAWLEFQTSKDDIKAIMVGAGSWLAGSLALMLPYFVLALTALLTKLPFSSGAVLADSFSRLNITTYWSNAQIVRWFTGFGGQLPNAMALYTLSWVFVIGVIVYGLVYFRPRQSVVAYLRSRSQMIFESLLALTAVGVGLSVGWGRMQRSGLDLVAWLILVLAVFGVIWLQASVKDEAEGSVPVALVVMSGALLGWPVLFPLLAVIFTAWLYSGTERTEAGRGALLSVSWLGLAGASLAFVRLGPSITQGMGTNLLALGVLVLPALVDRYLFKQSKNSHYLAWSCWALGGVLSSWLLSSLVPFGVAIVGIVLTGVWRKVKGDFGIVLGYTVLIGMACALLLAYWMPRWLNPRLLPL